MLESYSQEIYYNAEVQKICKGKYQYKYILKMQLYYVFKNSVINGNKIGKITNAHWTLLHNDKTKLPWNRENKRLFPVSTEHTKIDIP